MSRLALLLLPLLLLAFPVPAAPLVMQPALVIPLDGDGTLNARGEVLPLDVDGDGVLEYAHWNGRRLLRVFRQDGTKLWERANPAGYRHDRWTYIDHYAAWDIDGDGRDELLHCWERDGSLWLQVSDGRDGRVKREARLPSPLWEACHVALFFLERPGSAAGVPTLLVPLRAVDAGFQRLPGETDDVEYLSAVRAYDAGLSQLWQARTPEAGHWFHGVDADGDGRVEAVFAGRHRLAADGGLTCTLEGWPATDHVDSAQVADILPARPGLEMAAVGASGAALFDAGDCRRIWSLDAGRVPDPQHVVAGAFDPGSPGLELVIGRGGAGSGLPRIYDFVRADGTIVRSLEVEPLGITMHPLMNCRPDAIAPDKICLGEGWVMDWAGTVLLRPDWYRPLQELDAAERSLHRFDQWSPFAVTGDLLGDAREEMIVWGRHVLVVGRLAGG
ncbi:hypothetical protein [Marinimicrococcus flavescens]|uniref:VCBS repeat-containing protein n=1 Tax=Marinimicrococcus flavescens TaxID=3031815 RepID=A0AAP3V1J3_9PROT|nr:hypothetical protein [Marinimicrococcus flavescens]